MKITDAGISTSFDAIQRTLTGPLDAMPLQITGTRLRIIEASFDFEISIPGHTPGFIGTRLGMVYRCRAGEAFTEVLIRNPANFTAGLAHPITLAYGTGDIDDDALNIIPTRPNQFVRFTEAPATVVEQGRGTLAGGAAGGPLNGAATAGRGRRKFILITNEDPLLELNVTAAGGLLSDTQAIVWPKSTLRLDTDATIYVKNFGGTGVTWHYSQWFYTSPQA